MTSSRAVWVGCGIALGILMSLLFGGGLGTQAQVQPPAKTSEVGRYQISAWSHMQHGPAETSSQRGAYLVDTKTGEVFEVIGSNKPKSLGLPSPQQVTAAAGKISICPMLHAKQMPHGFHVEAMKFSGPAGDGRRGAAGFVVQTQKLLKGTGSRFWFTFQRDPSGYGFQVIHPLKTGHVLVSVSSDVTIHRGGSWGDIGWGNPATGDKVQLGKGAAQVLPLKAGTKHTVTSELSAQGKYRLWIDDVLICEHTINATNPLVLEVSQGAQVWGGSGWDKTSFAGEGFQPKLEPAHAGLILGPMDGSAPNQNFQQIHLSAVE